MKLSAKEIAGLVRTLSRTGNPKKFTSAIIAAAGSGSRMELDGETKQFLTLEGKPVVVHTLLAFEACPFINEIIVVARRDECERYPALAEQYHITKFKKAVPGGETRQDSVFCGLNAVDDKSEFVAIHDAARCLIKSEQIENVLHEAYLAGAATAASHLSDTVKREEKGFTAETLDRDHLYAATTPQCFKTELYRAAAVTAREENYQTTDDNALVEHIGFPVRLVDLGRLNLKITTKEDLILAEAVLKNRM